MSVTVELKKDMNQKVKTYPKAVKEALQAMLSEVWHKEYAKLHFTTQAYFIYGDVYKKRFQRLSKTARRAGVKAGLRNPMVFRGTMRRSVLSTIVVTGSSKRVRGRLPGSRVANFHTGTNDATGGYNMVRELRAVHPAEEKAMAEFFDKKMQEFLDEEAKVTHTF